MAASFLMRDALMQYENLKRSIVLRGHRTSVTLENAFWFGLREIADERGISLGSLVAEIDSDRTGLNLSSSLRLFVLEHFKKRAAAPVAHDAPRQPA